MTSLRLSIEATSSVGNPATHENTSERGGLLDQPSPARKRRGVEEWGAAAEGSCSKRARQGRTTSPESRHIKGGHHPRRLSTDLTETYRSSSPGSVPFLEAAATMLRRAEETGGPRTVRTTRGTSDDSPQYRPSPKSRNRNTSDHMHGHESHRSLEDGRGPPASGSHLLGSIGLAEFLQQDERPIFVVDIRGEAVGEDQSVPIIFVNLALRSRPSILNYVHGRLQDPVALFNLAAPFSDFKAWLMSSSPAAESADTFSFAGVLWKSSTVRRRLRVITGQPEILSTPEHNVSRQSELQSFTGLGSSGALSKEGDSRAGYFDMPVRSTTQTPGTMEHLVTGSFPADSPPVSNGDIGIQELLAGPLSPESEQEQMSFTVRRDPESLEGLNMGLSSDRGYFDWTRLPITPGLPSHIHFARSVNWAGTSLGPIEQWPADLRGMCNLIMASPHPSAMYWGRDNVAIYNEAYILLAGKKHPGLMGMRYQDAWAEIWDKIKDVFESARTTAQATMKDDDCLFLHRNGFLEETYFSWSIIPLIGDDGSVVGLYNPAFEKTRRKIAERRMLTLREIGEKIAAAREVSQFWGLLLEGLEFNEFDAPLVLVYSLQDDNTDSDGAASTTSSTAAASKQCYLEGTIGIEPGHPGAPHVIDLKSDANSYASVFRQAINNDKPIVLRADDGSLDLDMFDGVQWRGFGDPSKVLVVSPIRPTTGESTLGFLVMGTNPRRPYDEDYDLFIQLLGRQLATSIASVLLFEDEIKKGERAAQMAAQDRIELSNQLAVKAQEAIESENKFTRMAELAPVGMYIGNAQGEIVFVNDAWYDISSYPRDVPVGNDWIEYVVEEDKPKAWSLLETRSPISLEFRFKTPWRDKLGNSGHTWVIASASPEKDEDGNISRVFGSVTNISAQKFAEKLQTRRMEEAIELKRQQERYIDTTSHEMRNPLSAILQSADSITGSLLEMKEMDGLLKAHFEILDATIDSAQTITLCAQHQKRIVDDVLTLSKLDSAMLLVTPVVTQPVTVVRRALKMFEGELQTADIKLELRVDASLAQLGVDWVRLDPYRLSQVLINLTTNAIKFTTTQEQRVITMHIAASNEKPSQEDKWNLTYIPSRASKEVDVTAAPEWGMGEAVYIHFAVQDTGRGLNDLEKKQLFQRFSQANPRTHVHYGGSGLGLFISRELVELQGGEIGVASESGRGSTFAFYVKARRSSTPVAGSEDDQIMDNLQGRKGSTGKGNKLARIKSLTLPDSVAKDSSPSKASPESLPSTNSGILSASQTVEKFHVLVVEDNLINQKVLATQLRKLGCIVHVANHGGEAIDILSQSKFYHTHVVDGNQIDVVLMDLEMPIMDGQTCARKLREMQQTGEVVRHIPVIAVTANAREEQIKLTLESGIDDVVSKPFRIPELVPKMREVIEQLKGRG